jgi:hypothetical protein
MPITPNAMPRTATPVRTTTRVSESRNRCDYIRPDGRRCRCEYEVVATERVRVLRPLSKPNRALAHALRDAGLVE